MPEASEPDIKLFFSYAREDKPLRDELEKHCAWLKRRFQLTSWHDREILPGEDWEHAIDKHLFTADLILLLISPDFMNSDYCFGKEMQHALERGQAGYCRVIPILLRPVYSEDAPFSKLQLLPNDGVPITLWPNRDQAFQDVVTTMSLTIKELLLNPKSKENWLEEGTALANRKLYEEALIVFEQAIHLDPNYADAYTNKGDVLKALKRYKEAEKAYDKARQLDNQFPRIVLPPPTVSLNLRPATIQGMIDIYNAVNEQLINDPNFIMLMAARFQAVADNPVASAQFPIDAEKAAYNLMRRANLILESEEHRHRATAKVEPMPDLTPYPTHDLHQGG